MNYLKNIYKIFSIHIDENRIYGLDILRALAIIFVLYGHSRRFLEGYVDMRFYKFFLFDGVTIFFVLSGFLIGGILIKIVNTTDFNIKDLFNFWIRRWFRTIPIYFFILTVVFSLSFIVDGNLYFDVWKYYFFVQNLYSPHPYFFPEAWSLSVEEWFYLLVPVLLMFLIKITKNKKNAIVYVIISIILSTNVFRFYRALIYDCQELSCWGNYVRNLVFTRLDSLMFGVLGAYLLYYYNDFFVKNKNLKFNIGIALLFVPQLYDFIFQDMFFKNYLLFSFTSIGVLLMLPKMYSIKHDTGYLFKIVSIISLISYSMYLINYTLVREYFFKFIYFIIPNLLIENLINAIISYSLFWVFTILFSIILYKYIEIPMTKLRDKISL